MTKALAALRKAVELVPSHAKAQSNLTGLSNRTASRFDLFIAPWQLEQRTSARTALLALGSLRIAAFRASVRGPGFTSTKLPFSLRNLRTQAKK